MGDQRIDITSPMSIESDCKTRVAYDLMSKIAVHTGDNEQKKDKKYWLILYRQCWKAVDGFDIQQILQED